MFASLLSDLRKDIDEQSDEEIHGVRSEVGRGEGPEHGNFCPHGVGVHQSLSMCMFSQTWKLPGPHTVGSFLEASSHMQDESLTPFSALLISQDS